MICTLALWRAISLEFAFIVFCALIIGIVMGIYLKLYISNGK